MTQTTPLDPTASSPPTRRLLGHLTGQLSRRRLPAHRTADPAASATDDTGWWDLVRGSSGALSAEAPRAGFPPVTAATAATAIGSVAVAPADLRHTPTGGVPTSDVRVVHPTTPPAGVDGWLTARARSGPDPDAAPPAALPAAAAPLRPVPVPVRVPVWPAWVDSTSSLPTGDAARPVPVDLTVAATAPTVVRVSAARPAPVRAPVPRTGVVAGVPTPAPAPSWSAPTSPATTSPAPALPTPAAPVGPSAAAAGSDPLADPGSDLVTGGVTGGGTGLGTDLGTDNELLLTDGRRVPLTSTLLVGRNPAPRAGETVGALVAVEDPARSVSKTHLVVGVEDGRVWVVDRHSTNGTVVTLPDGQRILCVPERRVRLVAGASVHFGDHGFTLAAVAEPGRPG